MLRQLLGKLAEARAEAFLKRRGLSLESRNFRCRFGEIDLIMRDRDGTLVFVEVRSRSRGDFGSAAESITPAKQRRIILAAKHYIYGLAIEPTCRFDVVAMDRGQTEPIWIRDAFSDMR
jgi:putative endonuclease